MPARATILCIDDDELGLFVRSKILERSDYRVLCARSGREGLDILERETVDAVVLDYFMPAMNGSQVAWELKQRASRTPVLMLSSAIFQPEDANGLVDAFCAKLDGPAMFLQALQELLAEADQKARAAHA